MSTTLTPESLRQTLDEARRVLAQTGLPCSISVTVDDEELLAALPVVTEPSIAREDDGLKYKRYARDFTELAVLFLWYSRPATQADVLALLPGKDGSR